jgi:hypothetical protein
MPVPAIKISPSHETQRSAVTVRHKNTRTNKDFHNGSNTMLGIGFSPSSNDDSEFFNDNIGFEEVLEEDDDDDADDDDDKYGSIGQNNHMNEIKDQEKQQQEDCSTKKPQRLCHGKDKIITEFERNELIPALAIRSCHVPGNSVVTDFLQHMANVHPIFGICCHHRLHPVGTKMRLWNLFSSIMFGLTLTNCMWLWFFSHGMISDVDDHHGSIDPSKAVFYFQDKTNWTTPISRWTDGSGNETGTSATNQTVVSSGSYLDTSNRHDKLIYINQGMIILWTVGCTVHSIYDVMIWYLEVCSCCPRKNPETTVYHRTKYQQCGTALVIIMTVLCATTASNEAIIDSYYGKDSSSYENTNSTNLVVVDGVEDFTQHIELLNKEASFYEFVVSYFVELLLSLFVFIPILETILFSGVLGCCGLIPFLGGRPYEVKQALERRKQRHEHEMKQHQMGLDLAENDHC